MFDRSEIEISKSVIIVLKFHFLYNNEILLEFQIFLLLKFHV